MMTTEGIADAVFGEVFSGEAEHLYAVLDGASVPGLVTRLYDEQPEFVCLYRGELAPDMAEVAPYLVRLDPDAPFTQWVVEEGWGKHWGVFAASDAGLREVRQHLRMFLVVYTHDGKAQRFRYYDPRVMRIYLRSCNAAELKVVFGPVACFLVEDEDPATLLRFRPGDGGTLNVERRRLAPEQGG